VWQVTEGGSSSVWSVWSWVTELLLFGVVPLVILVLNVLVIVETRRLSAEERRLFVSVQMTSPRRLTSRQHHGSSSNAAAQPAEQRSLTTV